MPTYQYLCESCGHRFDIFQHFADSPLTTCPNCSGPIHRVLFPAGIVFKGSGFYKTDSRGASAAADPAPVAQETDNAKASSNGTAKAASKADATTDSSSSAKTEAAPASGTPASN
jgi:putative FmdB family regulatory protein